MLVFTQEPIVEFDDETERNRIIISERYFLSETTQIDNVFLLASQN